MVWEAGSLDKSTLLRALVMLLLPAMLPAQCPVEVNFGLQNYSSTKVPLPEEVNLVISTAQHPEELSEMNPHNRFQA